MPVSIYFRAGRMPTLIIFSSIYSRFPTPDSLFPVPCSLFPELQNHRDRIKLIFC
ncbi:MAG: hypothetical protein F6K26_45550 [Moorea sp. SIO2I5]|nr:hypothetical protein [Moorena sp. SIO2I5]